MQGVLAVTGGREGQVSSLGPVRPDALASRHISREDGAQLEQRWAPWQATLGKAKTSGCAVRQGDRGDPRAVAAHDDGSQGAAHP